MNGAIAFPQFCINLKFSSMTIIYVVVILLAIFIYGWKEVSHFSAYFYILLTGFAVERHPWPGSIMMNLQVATQIVTNFCIGF